MHAFTNFLQTYGYIAVFLLTMAEAACIPIPSEVVLGLGGALCSTAFATSGTHKHLDLVLVIIVAVLGELVGSSIAYVVGRTAGRTVVDRWGKYVLLSHKDLDKSDAWFAKRGPIAVLVARVIPIIRAFISLVAGIAEMNVVQFFLYSTIGIIVWCSVLVTIGYHAADTYESALKGFSWAGYLAAAGILVVLVVFYVHRFRGMRHEDSSTGA